MNSTLANHPRPLSPPPSPHSVPSLPSASPPARKQILDVWTRSRRYNLCQCVDPCQPLSICRRYGLFSGIRHWGAPPASRQSVVCNNSLLFVSATADLLSWFLKYMQRFHKSLQNFFEKRFLVLLGVIHSQQMAFFCLSSSLCMQHRHCSFANCS